MTVVYQTEREGEWQTYRCMQSGRQEFESYEANYKCRWLVLYGFAILARAMQGINIVAEWEWNEHCRGPRQILGPDL